MNQKIPLVRMGSASMVGLAILWVSANAAAVEPKDVLFAAIHNGSDSEVVTGQIADYWAKKTQSTSPVLMTAKVVKHFSQKECARLRVTLRQENVPTKNGKLGPFEFSYEMNLCADGLPPADGVDWSQVPAQNPTVKPEDIQ